MIFTTGQEKQFANLITAFFKNTPVSMSQIAIFAGWLPHSVKFELLHMTAPGEQVTLIGEWYAHWVNQPGEPEKTGSFDSSFQYAKQSDDVHAKMQMLIKLWGPSKAKIAEAVACGMVDDNDAVLVVTPELILQAKQNHYLMQINGALSELVTLMRAQNAPAPTMTKVLKVEEIEVPTPAEDDDPDQTIF